MVSQVRRPVSAPACEPLVQPTAFEDSNPISNNKGATHSSLLAKFLSVKIAGTAATR
jgi:hypothetical protein